MHARARTLIHRLDLRPHPEGGHYRRLYQSQHRWLTETGEHRSILTTIYYLLVAGEYSRWHRVDADEVWHHYEGDPLLLYCFDPAERIHTRHRLGGVTEDSTPVHVVPTGVWQAAEPLGSYTLAGCSVAPGFEFSGFSLIEEDEALRASLVEHLPDLARLL